MITAIDTNILLDILLPNMDFYEGSAKALQMSGEAGSLVISDIVYAEICVHFRTRNECEEFVESLDLRVESLTRASHFLASRAYRQYRAQGGKRTRILADFLIGAHAQNQATRLLSRDRGFYRSLFPALEVCDPSVAINF